jgi:hypothetical protein
MCTQNLENSSVVPIALGVVKEWENLNRNALAFLKLASISLCESFAMIDQVLRRTLRQEMKVRPVDDVTVARLDPLQTGSLWSCGNQ